MTARVRTSIIGVVVFALFSALFARLWYLQVAAADQFHAAATSNAVREIREPAPRGRILDAQGNVLVDNRVENDITVDRKISAADKKRVLKKLSVAARHTGRPARGEPERPAHLALHAGAGGHRRARTTSSPGSRSTSRSCPGSAPRRCRCAGIRTAASHSTCSATSARSTPTSSSPRSRRAQYALGDIDRQERRRAQLRVRPPRHAPECAGWRWTATGRVIRTLSDDRAAAGPRRPAHPRHRTRRRSPRPRSVRGSLSARTAKDTSYKKGFKTLAAPAGAVVVLDVDRPARSWRWRRTRRYDPNQFVHGIPDADLEDAAGQGQRLPAASTGRSSGQYAPGSTFKLDDRRSPGMHDRRHHPHQDDQRQRVRTRTPPTRITRSTATTGARYGRVDLNRALTVSSDVYFYTIGGDLYYRWKHQQPGGDALQDHRAGSAGSARPRASRCPTRRSVASRTRRGSSRSTTTNPAAFPYPDWLPGDNILSAVGQGDMLVTPIQLATAYATFANGGTRYSPRLASRGLRRQRHEDPRPAADRHRPRRRARTATRCSPGSPAWPRTEGRPPRACSPGSRRGWSAGKTGTAQVQGKQPTSLFVGHDPGGGAEVRRARGRRRGRLRRADRRADRAARHAAAQRPAR